MKKTLILTFILSFASMTANAVIGAALISGLAGKAVSNLGGAAIGGVGGGAVAGVATNLITGVVQERNLEKYKEQIRCELNGQKIASWDKPFNLPKLDLESARKEYYSKKIVGIK